MKKFGLFFNIFCGLYMWIKKLIIVECVIEVRIDKCRRVGVFDFFLLYYNLDFFFNCYKLDKVIK